MFTFIKTDSSNPDFRSLVTLLDKDLSIRDGDEHAFYAQFNKIDKIRNAIVCYEQDTAVGCGAFREYDEGRVEIKRMFVLPEHRGKGTGHAILKELEAWAAALGYTICILETGKKQPEAIRLYEKAGYRLMPSYGQYLNVENSVCMTKTL